MHTKEHPNHTALRVFMLTASVTLKSTTIRSFPIQKMTADLDHPFRDSFRAATRETSRAHMKGEIEIQMVSLHPPLHRHTIRIPEGASCHVRTQTCWQQISHQNATLIPFVPFLIRLRLDRPRQLG